MCVLFLTLTLHLSVIYLIEILAMYSIKSTIIVKYQLAEGWLRDCSSNPGFCGWTASLALCFSFLKCKIGHRNSNFFLGFNI